jgi:AcrR family transcriptional regulator
LTSIKRLINFLRMDPVIAPPPKGTALALIDAAIALFGTKGFAATSTREIAERAETNVASISYHFGGKDGLRRACAEEFVRRMHEILGPPVALEHLSPTEAETLLKNLLHVMTVRVLTESSNALMVNFVIREITEKSETIDIFYNSLIAVAHKRLSMLWSIATGAGADSPETALRAFSVIGQVVYFRLGSEIVLRRMGWAELGREQAEDIYRVLQGNLDALLDQARRAAP